MSRQKTVLAFATIATCALTTAARGEDPVPITDPQALVAMGFAPTIKNVYAFPDRLNQPLRPGDEAEEYWGGSTSGFSTYVGQEFKPETAVAGAAMWTSQFDAGDIRPGNGDRAFLVQLTDVPNGARLQALRWWAFDTNTTADIIFRVEQICQPHLVAGPAVITVLGTQSTLGSAGNQSGELILNVPVDVRTCVYRVWVGFGVADPTQVLYKVRAQWLRQVSPAPPTARFLDVPTAHPFFRFIEALAASGITGGCSGNQFCPDSPVTRGQMAVFLSTALGLSWGGL